MSGGGGLDNYIYVHSHTWQMIYIFVSLDGPLEKKKKLIVLYQFCCQVRLDGVTSRKIKPLQGLQAPCQ